MNYNPQTIRCHVKVTGQNIHTLRRKKRFTLYKLSRLSGVPERLIDQYELGKNNLLVSDLLKIATVLKVEVRELLPQTRNEV